MNIFSPLNKRWHKLVANSIVHVLFNKRFQLLFIGFCRNEISCALDCVCVVGTMFEVLFSFGCMGLVLELLSIIIFLKANLFFNLNIIINLSSVDNGKSKVSRSKNTFEFCTSESTLHCVLVEFLMKQPHHVWFSNMYDHFQTLYNDSQPQDINCRMSIRNSRTAITLIISNNILIFNILPFIIYHQRLTCIAKSIKTKYQCVQCTFYYLQSAQCA
ncbi:hypothetical protein AGLY_010655 [Aphis glycines]|uniref:Uncharacterized protein n=1 Tax=Aphis glycines TaxID=307491 RepID=A0A6G0TE61_APHGL|nr:hypothetical protein AGLY_010655 [Aphis glycines]